MPTLDDSLTRVLLAVLCLPRPTTGTCARYTGLSTTTVHRRLHHLRDLGLISFESGKRGTIRPLFRRVNAAI